jgi:O-acetyl-ADP-ribose deacetylase (regulator of RNase III)
MKIQDTELSLIQGDITQQETEAIVNAANSSLMGGGGVDGAIHRAGGPAILEECKRIRAQRGPLPPGQAVVTTGGNLKARYVIHTVGPIWQGGHKNEAVVLTGAYQESLKLARVKDIKTISFPSISTGAYGYPLEEAAQVAVETVVNFLNENPGALKEVCFVLFDHKTYVAYEQVLKKI